VLALSSRQHQPAPKTLSTPHPLGCHPALCGFLLRVVMPPGGSNPPLPPCLSLKTIASCPSFPCLSLSRPVLSFDASFDEQPHLQLLKEVLGQVFGTPSRHHKAKPFFDHVFSFSVADGCIWMRNYQVGSGRRGG
jgi:hypothetical protein